jgi:hypothetical protein
MLGTRRYSTTSAIDATLFLVFWVVGSSVYLRLQLYFSLVSASFFASCNGST